MSEIEKLMKGMAEGLIRQSKELAERAGPSYGAIVYLRALRRFYSSKPFIVRLFISKTEVIKAASQRAMNLILWDMPSIASRLSHNRCH